MSKKLPQGSAIAEWLEAEQKAAALRLELAEVEGKATELRPEVQHLVDAAAQRWLVDAQGNPVDGGVYWFSHIGLVRVNGVIKIIPIETMDEAKVFTVAAEAKTEEATA